MRCACQRDAVTVAILPGGSERVADDLHEQSCLAGAVTGWSPAMAGSPQRCPSRLPMAPVRPRPRGVATARRATASCPHRCHRLATDAHLLDLASGHGPCLVPLDHGVAAAGSQEAADVVPVPLSSAWGEITVACGADFVYPGRWLCLCSRRTGDTPARRQRDRRPGHGRFLGGPRKTAGS